MAEIIKISSEGATASPEGEIRLAVGERVGLRLWRDEPPNADKPARRHDYEVVGFVLSGRAELEIEGQVTALERGDSWIVPAGASHTYRIRETFSAVEAVAPPAVLRG